MRNYETGVVGGNFVTIFGVQFDSNMIAFAGLAATVIFGIIGAISKIAQTRANNKAKAAEEAYMKAKTEALLRKIQEADEDGV